LLSNKLDFELEGIDNPRLEKKIRSGLKSNGNNSLSLGFIEDVIVHCGLIQNKSKPELQKPVIVVFSADHGVNDHLKKSNHTYQKILNSLHGISPVSILSLQNQVPLRLIDVGVNHNFESDFSYWYHHGNLLLSKKVGAITSDITQFPAMTTQQCEEAFKVGFNTVIKEKRKGSNTVGLSSFSDRNPVSDLAVASALLDEDPAIIAGKNTDEQTLRLVTKALAKHPKTHDPATILTLFGGFETVALTGAILEAARLKMLLAIDGLTALTALAAAEMIKKGVSKYCVAANSPNTYLINRLGLRCLIANNINEEGVSANLSINVVKSALVLNAKAST